MKTSLKYFAFATVLSFALIPFVTPVETANGKPSLLNGITLNGFTINGGKLNGIAVNALRINGLTFNGLTFNGLTFNSSELSPTVGTIATLNGNPVEAMSLEGSQLVLQVRPLR